MQKITYRRDATHTYRQQLADFITTGKWTLTNYFSFIIIAMVNGQPSGPIEGHPTGENFGYCAICGTSIIHHYTVTDSISKRSVNIGCECIQKIFGEQKGQMISRAVQSLQNKVKSDFMRPFKHDLLSVWLKKIATTDADDIRGQQVISELIDYWEKEKHYTDIDEALANQFERTEGPFNYWNYHASMFSSRDWNPDNMRSQYKKMAEQYDTELPPKWNEIKLTDEQQKILNQKIVYETNKYIEELKKKMEMK